MRERLFDIDVIVNRTMVYVGLSAVLAAIYAATVAFSQRVIIAATREASELSAVLATLVVVASFSPVKDALQRAVDRRFKGPGPAIAALTTFAEQVSLRVSTIDRSRSPGVSWSSPSGLRRRAAAPSASGDRGRPRSSP